MISAFGVDHGEISKAWGAGALRSLGTAFGGAARAGASRSGQMAGRNLARGGVAKPLGQAQIKMGQGLKRTSNFAMKRPGLTGGLLAGGAGAGVGGGTALAQRRTY